jgi:hypothetical protein
MIYRGGGLLLTTADLGGTTNTSLPYFEIVGSPSDSFLVKEVAFTAGDSPLGGRDWSMAFGLSNPRGASPRVSYGFVPDDVNAPPTLAYITADWAGKPPGRPAKFWRTAIAGCNTNVISWRSQRGIGIAPGQAMAVWSFGIGNVSSSAVTMWVEIDV